MVELDEISLCHEIDCVESILEDLKSIYKDCFKNTGWKNTCRITEEDFNMLLLEYIGLLTTMERKGVQIFKYHAQLNNIFRGLGYTRKEKGLENLRDTYNK